MSHSQMRQFKLMKIFEAISKERERQDSLYPGFSSNQEALMVLGAEVGEVFASIQKNRTRSNLEEELVQVATVCVKWLEILGHERQ